MAKKANVNVLNDETEVVQIEQQEQFYAPEKKKNIGKLIFDIVFWVAIVALLFIWVFDFLKVKGEEAPVFCIQEKTHEFDDGTVHECVGLGYKVYTYDRESINIKVQFSPFFVGMEE